MIMQRLLIYFFLLFLPLYSLADGNGTLGNSYNFTDCGVNYIAVSHVLGKRFNPAGLDQPAAFVINGLPPCAKIEKAFLYADASGNGDPQTVVVTGPQLAPSFPMTIIGTGPDKCWGYSKTVSYRADITPVVTGNGTYTINGFSTDNLTDIDGATILVIYSDPSAAWRGTILLDDGAKEGQGSLAYTMHYLVLCNTVTNVKAFMAVGDADQGEAGIVNGETVNSPDRYWNFYEANTSLGQTQTNSLFNINSANDCYNIVLTGLYYRSTCGAPCNAIEPLQVSATGSSSRCDSCNGTAHATATGGSGPYIYSWAPTGGNAADATNLCPGTYTVTVQSDCGSVSKEVTISNISTGFTLGDDINACLDSTVRLKPSDTSGGIYFWNTGSTECCINVNVPGTYWLREGVGCTASSDTIKVTMHDCDTRQCIYFPNAFTPNNDGINDLFGPVMGCRVAPDVYHLRIYDRWERMIFESHDVNYRWDGTYKGTPQDIGVYFYQLQYSDQGKQLKGNFTLVK